MKFQEFYRRHEGYIVILLIIVGIFKTFQLLHRENENYKILRTKESIEKVWLNERGVKMVVEILRSDIGRSIDLRYWVYYLGNQYENYKYIPIFKSIIETRESGDMTRLYAIEALTKVTKNISKEISYLIDHRYNFNSVEKYYLMKYLAEYGGSECIDDLYSYVESLKDNNKKDLSKKIMAILGLGRIGTEKAKKYLEELLKSEKNKIVREVIEEAINLAEKKNRIKLNRE